MSVSLQDLWNSARTGDEKAYASIMRGFANSMFSYGTRFVRDESFVKDCIQNVFIELWSRRENIKQIEAVRTYLLKALRLRIFREKLIGHQGGPLKDTYPFSIDFDIKSSLTEESASTLRSVLNHLPPRQKEILYLRFFEGLGADRIWEIMNLDR